MGAEPRLPPLGLAAALKVVNRDLNRCSEMNRDRVDVKHAAKAHDLETPQALWKTRCGWMLGCKACLDGKAWRTPEGRRGLGARGGRVTGGRGALTFLSHGVGSF